VKGLLPRPPGAVVRPLAAPPPTPPPAATYTTQNFVVTAPSEDLARKFGDMAEQYRSEKARLWLGQDMPPWPRRCPLKVQITDRAAGGGATLPLPPPRRPPGRPPPPPAGPPPAPPP